MKAIARASSLNLCCRAISRSVISTPFMVKLRPTFSHSHYSFHWVILKLVPPFRINGKSVSVSDFLRGKRANLKQEIFVWFSSNAIYVRVRFVTSLWCCAELLLTCEIVSITFISWSIIVQEDFPNKNPS